MDPLSILAKLTFALVCGGIVGWQREAHDRPAGLRTHVLVCLGSAVYTLASMSFHSPNTDPSRVAAQVATGMGFLGAGTIIRQGSLVTGLTTAASLWAVAAIGLCVAIGGDAWWVAGISTILVLLTLTVLRRVERVFVPRAHTAVLALRLEDPAQGIGAVRDALEQHGLTMDSLEVSRTGAGLQETHIRIALPAACDLTAIGSTFSRLDGFLSMRCE